MERSVIMVSFDIPAETKPERRDYRVFHKYLKQSGFLMLQQSLYVKMITASSNKSEYHRLRKYAPVKGNVLVWSFSLNAFQKMTVVAGNNFDFHTLFDEILCF